MNISALRPGERASALLYLHSCGWRQAATLAMHAQWRAAAREVFGSGVRLSMDAVNTGAVSGLSFYELSRKPHEHRWHLSCILPRVPPATIIVVRTGRGIVDVMLPEATNGVSCNDIAAIWVAFFSRWQRYRC